MNANNHPDAALREIELAVMPLRDAGEHERSRRVQEAADALAELIERMNVLVTQRELSLSGKPECSADWINAKLALARCRGGES